MADRPTILIVDDDARYVELLALTLRRSGYQVLTALGGEDALIAAKNYPDLVILDIVMPKMDGYEVADRLASVAGKAIPFIFLTAKGQPHHRLAGLGLGAVEYITKPFHPDQLLSKIEATLGSAVVTGRREEQ